MSNRLIVHFAFHFLRAHSCSACIGEIDVVKDREIDFKKVCAQVSERSPFVMQSFGSDKRSSSASESCRSLIII
jgi:hypothetical protein